MNQLLRTPLGLPASCGAALALLSATPIYAISQTVTGRVVSERGGSPVGQAIVELSDSNGMVVSHVYTSGSGRFSAPTPAAARYRLDVRAIGFAIRPPEQVTVPAAGLQLGDVPLRASMPAVISVSRTGLPEIVVRGRRVVEKVSHLYRMWDGTSGQPIALVDYAVGMASLMSDGGGIDRQAVVDLGLTQRNWVTGSSRDTSVRLHIPLPDVVHDQDKHIGYFVASSLTDIDGWTMIATQPFRRGGGDWEPKMDLIPPAEVMLSDLVLGDAGHQLTATLHGTRVVLAPLDSLDRRDTLSSYFQVKSKQDQSQVTATTAVYRADVIPPITAPVLSADEMIAIHAGVNEWSRPLDLRKVAPGFYRLEVTLRRAGGGVLAHQYAYFELR